jgi:hypothetical protein
MDTSWRGIRSIGRSPVQHTGGTGIEARILHAFFACGELSYFPFSPIFHRPSPLPPEFIQGFRRSLSFYTCFTALRLHVSNLVESGIPVHGLAVYECVFIKMTS